MRYTIAAHVCIITHFCEKRAFIFNCYILLHIGSLAFGYLVLKIKREAYLASLVRIPVDDYEGD